MAEEEVVIVECCVRSNIDDDDDRVFMANLFGCCYTLVGIVMCITFIIRINRVHQVNHKDLIYSLSLPFVGLFWWMLLFVWARYDFPCISTFMRRIFCFGEQNKIHPANDNSIP